MAREPASATRYDAVVATFVGVLALLVSAYTAYTQRQQVRAEVWPYIEIFSNTEPAMSISVANKGVGPALIKDVVITFDGRAVSSWNELLDGALGPGKHHRAYSTVDGRVLGAGERIDALQLRDEHDAPAPLGPAGSESARFREALSRIGVRVCYCSTLGDCWTLDAPAGSPPTRTETRRCPAPSPRSFRE